MGPESERRVWVIDYPKQTDMKMFCHSSMSSFQLWVIGGSKSLFIICASFTPDESPGSRCERHTDVKCRFTATADSEFKKLVGCVVKHLDDQLPYLELLLLLDATPLWLTIHMTDKHESLMTKLLTWWLFAGITRVIFHCKATFFNINGRNESSFIRCSLAARHLWSFLFSHSIRACSHYLFLYFFVGKALPSARTHTMYITTIWHNVQTSHTSHLTYVPHILTYLERNVSKCVFSVTPAANLSTWTFYIYILTVVFVILNCLSTMCHEIPRVVNWPKKLCWHRACCSERSLSA